MSKGQALISLIFYILIILTVTSAAVILTGINSLSTSKNEQGLLSYYLAESGAENAVLRLLRDPGYTGETNLPIGDGFVNIIVTPGNPVSIVSVGQLGKNIRKVQVRLERITGTYTIRSWQEIP